MEMIDEIKFEKARNDAENFYRTIDEIWCPYFREKISFNAKGIEHIKFVKIRQARPHQDQYIRFRLLPLASEIIKASHTLQGKSVRKNFEREKTHNRWETVMRTTTYYEFVAVIKEVRVRVIVKQVEAGPKYFWSIIPFWKMDKITGKRILHSGKPEVD